jgi:NTP pyrophosphatase (non-canonical NTP hydrolase)
MSDDSQKVLHEHLKRHLTWPNFDSPVEHERYIVLALCGEAGELANLVKKDWRGDSGTVTRREMIKKELADVGNYAFMLAELLGVDLQAEMLKKLIEVEQRPTFKERI